MLVGLILDGKVKGKIDQVGGRLELDRGCVSLDRACLSSAYSCAERTLYNLKARRREGALRPAWELVEPAREPARNGSRQVSQRRAALRGWARSPWRWAGLDGLASAGPDGGILFQARPALSKEKGESDSSRGEGGHSQQETTRHLTILPTCMLFSHPCDSLPAETLDALKVLRTQPGKPGWAMHLPDECA